MDSKLEHTGTEPPSLMKSGSTPKVDRSARIAGSVQAVGGSANDIRVLVVKGQSIIFDSGKRRTIVMSVDFSEPGQYTLIFDNTFSLVSAKVVSGTVSLVNWGLDPARNAAEPDPLQSLEVLRNTVIGRD